MSHSQFPFQYHHPMVEWNRDKGVTCRKMLFLGKCNKFCISLPFLPRYKIHNNGLTTPLQAKGSFCTLKITYDKPCIGQTIKPLKQQLTICHFLRKFNFSFFYLAIYIAVCIFLYKLCECMGTRDKSSQPILKFFFPLFRIVYLSTHNSVQRL